LTAFIVILGGYSVYNELKVGNMNVGIHPAKFSTPPTIKTPPWNNY
jgi:hypothetical protein